MKKDIINNILFVLLIFILFYYLFINTNKVKEGISKSRCKNVRKKLKKLKSDNHKHCKQIDKLCSRGLMDRCNIDGCVDLTKSCYTLSV